MKMRFGSKLSLSYAAMALLLVALISFCINVLMQAQFKNYVIRQQEQKNREFVNLVEKQYRSSEGTWNGDAIENIGVGALEEGMILRVTDGEGKTVWDARIHNNGLCVQMLSSMAANMQNHDPGFIGGYVQTGYPLQSDGKEIGRLEIGYYGPYYYTDNDLAFLSDINRILIAVGVLSLGMAFLLGAFMARRVSAPISRAIETAEEIARGNFRERITERYGTLEMSRLTDTVNRLADSLQSQEDLRRRMSADVAHELRTPLTNLQSSLEAMMDGIWRPDRERLASCHEEILRIGRLIGDLEKLERMEAENAALDLGELDLSELVRHIVRNFETEFYKKGVRLDFSGEAAELTADRDKIGQVAVNLISNALKYTPPGGRVEVRVEAAKGTVRLMVRDNGEGIAPEDLPFVFERFYRADRSRSRLTGGSGLGLTISKAIIQSHGGEIAVASEPGKGSTFVVSLPKAGPESSPRKDLPGPR